MSAHREAMASINAANGMTALLERQAVVQIAVEPYDDHDRMITCATCRHAGPSCSSYSGLYRHRPQRCPRYQKRGGR
ncbi:MAG: hypothetical protein EOP38_24290 [Rubrivivax sp.]|nr:MAG: hypothetical protein EOP38_24290 [Rubrivivax sp.]